MSDNELNIFANLPARHQHAQRLNYHALNDNSDEEAFQKNHIFKKS